MSPDINFKKLFDFYVILCRVGIDSRNLLMSREFDTSFCVALNLNFRELVF